MQHCRAHPHLHADTTPPRHTAFPAYFAFLLVQLLLDFPFLLQISATGTRTRVARVRAEYPNQLDYSGVGGLLVLHCIRK